MPHAESTKKRLRQNVKRHLRNKAVKSRLRTETTKFRRAIERGDLDGARAQLALLVKLLHQACVKGVIHSNAASRRQSRLQGHFNKLVAARS